MLFPNVVDTPAPWSCETGLVLSDQLLMATLEGYATEGGYDQPFAPATAYGPAIALGRVTGPGAALSLWRDYEAVIDAAARLGLDGLRCCFEWARIEPRRGEVDEEALARYQRVAQRIHERGLALTLVLVENAWPAWLGQEAWLLPWVVPHVVAHAQRVATNFPEAKILPFAHERALVSDGYLKEQRPPWRRRAQVDAEFAASQLAATQQLLAADDLVGPRLVTQWRTGTVDNLAKVRAGSTDVGEEVYLEPLVRGASPHDDRDGFLVFHGGAWQPGPLADYLVRR